MLRIVERLAGEGRVVSGGRELTRSGYTLSVYREWQPLGGTLVPGGFVLEGHLHVTPDVLAALEGRGDLWLALDDGRGFPFYLVSPDGALAGADGEGLRPPS